MSRTIVVGVEIDQSTINQVKQELESLKNTKVIVPIEIDNTAMKQQQSSISKELQDSMKDGVKIPVQFDTSKLNQNKSAITKAVAEVQKVQKQMSNSSGGNKSTGLWTDIKTNMKAALDNTIRYKLAYEIVNKSVDAVKQMEQAVEELDADLTEFNKVADLSTSGLESFVDKAYDAAEKIGRTGSDMIKASTEFKRAGYDVDESLNMGNAALVMTNVADGIDSTEESASTLISVLKGFNMDDADIMNIVDKMNSVSNQSPVGFDNLAEGLERVSGTMNQAGNSIDQTLGLLTGGCAQLRNMSKVSTGLITISQRLRGIDEDGSEIDGLSAKLGDSFDKIGVAIEDSNGELRSTYDIMSDYAKIYPTLTSEQKQYYAELAAGKHQVNVFNAIVQQMSDVKNAVEQSIDSVGSAANENEIYRQSIAGLKNEFGSQFEMLSKETIDDEWLKNLISSGTSFLKVLTNIVEQDDLVSGAISGITDIIKGLASTLESISDNDGMASLMKMLLAYGTVKKGVDIFQSFRNTKDTLSAVEKFFKNANSGNIQMKSGFLQVGDAEEKAAGGIKNFISQMKELKASGMSTTDILKAGFSTVGESISGVLIAHPVAAALTAFTGILAVASAMTTDAKEKVDKAVSSSEKYEQTKSDIQSIESELETVGNQIDELNAKDHLSFTDQAELSNLQSQSAELERQLELKQALADIQQDQAARDAKDAFNSYSARNAVDTNKEGFFTNLFDGLESFSAWINDKTGQSKYVGTGLIGAFRGTNENIGQTADETLLDRIQQAQKAADDLKDLQKSQTADNYDKVQKDIEDQQKVVDNYRDNIQELYSTMESYASSFYNQDTGNVLTGYEDEAKRWEEVQKEYLNFFTNNSGKSIDQSIEGVLSKVKFNGIKDTLVKAGEEGSDALNKALSEGNYSGLITALSNALNVNEADAKDKLKQYIMSVADPDGLDIDEVKRQLLKNFTEDDAGLGRKLRTAGESAWEQFTKGMSEDDFKILYSIQKENDTSTWEIEDWKKAFDAAKESAEESENSITSITEKVTKLKTAISSINEMVDGQTTGSSISPDLFDDGTLDDYASALEYVNGNYQLNREEVKKITEAKVKEQLATNDLAKAQQQQEYVKNAQEISELTQKLQNNTLAADESAESIQSQIDALTSANAAIVDQCKQYDLLNASLRESIGVYQEWKDAQNAAESGDMFDDTKNAWQQIRDVADKDSDDYNRVGTHKYQASVDLLVPDSIDHSDQKAVQKYLDSIRKYMTFDKDGNVNGVNMDKFFSNAVKKGLMIDDGENYQLAGEMTMKDFAEGMNMALPFVQAVFGEILEFKPEDEQWFSWDDEAVESLGDLSVAASDALSDLTSSTMSADLQNQLDELSEGGNVDLKVRPVIDAEELTKAGWDDAGDGIATVFTSTYSNEDGTVAMNFTPIMTDGKGNATGVMSPEELQSYAEDVISGVREDDLNLKIGATFEGEDAIDQASKVAEQIHEIQGTTEYTKARLSSAFSNLGVNLDLSGIEDDKKKVESLTNTIEQMKNVKATPGVDTSQIQDANTVIQYCVQQIQQLNAPVIMSVDTSMVQGQVGQALTTLQNFKQAANDLQVLTEIGADTTDAQAKVDGLVSEVQSINPKIIAELGIDTSSADTISQSIQGIQPEMLVKLGVDDAAIIGYTAEDKDGKVVYTVDHSQVDTYNPPNLNRDVTYTIKTEGALPSGSIASPVPGSGSKSKNNKKSGGHSLNGTAHAGGTWGAKTGDTTLVGELGREIVVDPNTGKWHTVGDNGAEFTNIPKGAIVFNHLQTEELLENGFVTSRASALVSGNALMSGNAMIRGGIPKSVTTKKNKKQKTTEKRSSSKSKSKSKSSNKSTNANTKATNSNTQATEDNTDAQENLQDWISRLCDVSKDWNDSFKNAIDQFEMNYNQNKAIDEYVANSESYKNTLRNSANNYMSRANSLGLSGDYIHKIWTGTMDIENITDENVRDKIEKYTEWYDKARDLNSEIADLNKSIRETKIQKLDNIKDDYDNLVSLSTSISDYNESVSDLSEKLTGVGDANALLRSANAQVAIRQALVNSEAQLNAQLNALVADGTIGMYTDTWNKWQEEINGVKKSIIEADEALNDLKKSIMEVRFNSFTKAIDNLGFQSDMSSAIQDLLLEEGIYDDDVKITSTGYTKLGLLGTDLVNAKQKVADYNEAIRALKENYKQGNISQADFNEQLQEYQKDQMDAVSATKTARDAIIDLIKDGIEKETDAMDELISKRKEDLDKQKEYYDFKKKMNDQSKEMNKVRAQLAALEGDDSLEATAKRRKLESQLKDLQEQYDEDQKDHEKDVVSDAYDKTLEDFKKNQEDTVKELESSLEKQNQAISDALEAVKNNYGDVYETLTKLAEQYNFSLTDDLTSPWTSAEAALKRYQDSIGKLNGNISSIDISKINPSKPSSSATTPTRNESKYVTNKSENGTWINQGGSWWYQHNDGGYSKDDWEYINGAWYKFDREGWMQYGGWQPWGYDSKGNRAWYYLNSNGDMATGWKQDNGKWYYLDASGMMQTGWAWDGKAWYFMDNSGAMVTSQWISGKNGEQYYVTSTGAMATNGYVRSGDGTKYYWVNGQGVWEPQWDTPYPNLNKYKLYYSTGTPKAKNELAFMDDTDGKLNLGSEAMITEKGILGNWGGNVIFSKEQTQALYNMSNGIFPGMDQMIKNVKANAAPVNITNNVSQGDINVHYDSLVTVQGDVSKDMFPGVEKMAKESFEYTVKQFKKHYGRLR